MIFSDPSIKEKLTIKSVSIMSKNEIKVINKLWKGFLFVLAVIVAVCALRQNPGHLFTAGFLLVASFESNIVKKEDHDIC